MAHKDADAVVIGAGIIGAAVALELARGGRSVVCVDKGPAPGAGSTSASSSIIRFSYSTRDAVLTSWESAFDWRDWAGYLGVADPDGMAAFIHTGMLLLETPDGVLDPVLALWDELGIAYERFDADGLRGRFPAFDPGRYFPPKPVADPAFGDEAIGALTAVLEPEAGYIDDPMLAARNLAYAAKAHGASFRFRVAVAEIERAGDRVAGVRLAGGETISAPVVVNAAGPHSSLINSLAGIAGEMRISHRALRQEVFVVPAPDNATLAAGTPVVSDPDLGTYFRPQAGDTIMVGGVEAACDELEWVDPDDWRDHVTLEQFETLVYRLARRIPDLRVPARPSGVAALYDVTDDWVPLYDCTSLRGFFMACGTSGNQFKNAPMAGRFIAALVDDAAEGRDHDTDPVQLAGPHTGRAIDLSAFSRLRQRSSTSGTVMG